MLKRLSGLRGNNKRSVTRKDLCEKIKRKIQQHKGWLINVLHSLDSNNEDYGYLEVVPSRIQQLWKKRVKCPWVFGGLKEGQGPQGASHLISTPPPPIL